LFERPHHRRVATVLESLNAQLLAANECWFGGGTAMALRYGEYRESVDIDFLVSSLAGYRKLRQILTGPEGFAAICLTDSSPVQQARELRADQYGMRTLLRVEEVEIKFEVVLEARIGFDQPGAQDRVCGVHTLTPLDLLASKLLANSDRWRDDAVLSRDLIDMAMMAPPKALLQQALTKAETAYGASIRADLDKAVALIKSRPQRLDQCMLAMGMSTTPKALLWDHIRSLARQAQA
jgi:hypothetical protein